MDSDNTLCSLLALALKENIVQLLLALLKKGKNAKSCANTHASTHSRTRVQTHMHTLRGFCSEISDLYSWLSSFTDYFHGDI